jgi:Domain of unknown function (DUF4328)/Domain of unknown function (DUF4190)/Protein of unknown function (DUF2510)
MRAPGGVEWRSTLGLRGWLTLFLGATAVCGLSFAGAMGWRASAPVSELHQRDGLAGVLGVFLLILTASSALLFLIWLWKSAHNAAALGRTGARYSPGWSVGGWFIPFGNLFIPVVLTQDLWRASDPATQPGTDWRDGPRSGLIGWWWAGMIACALLGYTSSSGSQSHADLSVSTVRNDARIAVAIGLVWAGAAVLSILITRRITERQQVLFERDGLSPLLSRVAGAAWYADPVRRSQYRYWDGNSWTAHVRTSTNGMAIASMVLGIIWIYWVGSILALVFGFVALNQIKSTGGTQPGRGMAIAGVVLGCVGVGILVTLLIGSA